MSLFHRAIKLLRFPMFFQELRTIFSKQKREYDNRAYWWDGSPKGSDIGGDGRIGVIERKIWKREQNRL